MNRVQQAVVVAVVCVLAASAGFFVSKLRSTDEVASAQTWLDQQALPTKLASFELPDTSGTIRISDDWSGQTLVINFWATWCEPCRDEIPLLNELSHLLAADGVAIIGIAVDDLEAARAFGDSVGIDYPSLVAGADGYDLLEQYNPKGVLPFSLVVDPAGNIKQSKVGVWTREELEAAVADDT